MATPARARRQAFEAPHAGPGRPQARGPADGAGESAVRAAGTTRVEGNPLEIDWSQTVRLCMSGDSGAWAELVRTHHRRVYGLCYRFTGNPADAEDLTQDVFLKIYSNLASFDTTRGSLQVWITTMTRNLLVDNFRRTRNQRATSSLDENWESAEELKPVDRLVASGGAHLLLYNRMLPWDHAPGVLIHAEAALLAERDLLIRLPTQTPALLALVSRDAAALPAAAGFAFLGRLLAALTGR